MEPVEIELRMKQNLEAESKKAKQSVEALGAAAEKSQDDIKENIAIQKKVIAELKKELKPLEEAFKKVNVGTTDPKVLAERKKLSAIVKQMTADLKGEEKALTELEQRTETTGKKMTSLRTQMMNVRDTMGGLKLAGKENTEEYRKLEEQLGVLGTAYRELRTVEQAVSTGGTQLGGFMDGLNALSGSLSAGVGAIGLFNDDTEKMAEIQTKVQSIMAISIGLMQVSNVLHSTSAFRITTVTTVKKLWAAANLKVATTLGISNLAAKALMATLTLGLSVAITGIIFLMSKYASSQQKAAKETKKYNEIVTDSASEQLVAYEKLKQGYQALNGDMQKQTQYVQDNEKEFEKLGLAIDDVNEAERLFSEEGTDAFTSAITERAKAVAAMEMASEKYKEYLIKMREADDREKSPSKLDKTSSSKDWYNRDGKRILLYDRAVEEADKLREEAKLSLSDFRDYVDDFVESEKKAKELFDNLGGKESGLSIGTKAYWEKQKKDAKKALESMKETQKGTDQWNAELTKYKQATDRLKAWSFDDKAKEKKEPKNDHKEREALARRYKALELETEQARIEAMQDGAERTLAQNELNHQRRLVQIDNQKADLLSAMRELEKATWEAGGGKGVFTSKIKELPAELNASFIEQTKASLKELELSNNTAIKKLLESPKIDNNSVSAIIRSVAKTQQEKLAHVSQYEALKLKELAKKEQQYDAETYKKKKALIKKEAQAAGEAIRDESLRAMEGIPRQLLDDLFKDFDLSFANLDHATLGQLNNVADKLAKLSLNRGELIELGLTEAQITRLESLLAELKSEGASNIQTARLREMQTIFGEIGSLMAQAGDDITRSIGEMVTAISGMITTLNDPNASGFQKASGIVSLAITAGNELSKIRSSEMTKEVDAQIRKNKGLADQLTLERELNNIQRERAEQERNSSAFLSPHFVDDYKAALNTIKESEQLMNNSLGSLMQNAVFSAKGSAKRRLFGRKSGTYDFTIQQLLGEYEAEIFGKGGVQGLSPLHNGLEMLNNGSGSAFNMILSSVLDPAGIFGGYADSKARQNALGNLRGAFDKTFEAMGKTAADVANMTSREWVDFFSLMDEMGYITDEGTKEMVENAKRAAEEYAKAMEELKDIISNVAGSLGSELQNNLVTAFENGEDAALAFKKTVNDVLKSIFMKNLEAVFFQKYFDKLQEDMKSSMDGGDGDWSDDIMRFFTDIEPALGQAQDAMAAWDKQMEAAGYDGFSNERQGKTKGIAQASQDSIDELNGRMMAISGNVYHLREMEAQSISMEKEALLYQRTISSQLDTIAANTAYCRYLEDVNDNLEDIKTKGVKLR